MPHTRWSMNLDAGGLVRVHSEQHWRTGLQLRKLARHERDWNMSAMYT